MSGLIQFRVDSASVGPYLERKRDRIIDALMQRTTAINTALQAKIAGEKLQGELLKSHTGKLAGSVRVIPTVNSGGAITGGVQAGGGPAFYAKFQEDGTTGPYTIMPKDPKGVLAFEMNGRMVFARKVVHPGLQAKRFMAGTLEEERDNIVQSLHAGVKEASL